MSKQVVTTYTYDLAQGVAEGDFIAASQNADRFLQAQTGFHYRSLAKLPDGNWLDIVYWENADCAKQGNAAFEQNSDCQIFMGMLSESSIKIQNAELHTQIMSDQAAA